MGVLDRVYYGNDLWDWLWAAAATVLVFSLLRVLRSVVAGRLLAAAARSGSSLSGRVAEMLRRTRLFFILVVALYSGALVLTLSPKWQHVAQVVMVLAVALQAGSWGTLLIGYLVADYVRREPSETGEAAASAAALTFIGKLLLWVGLLIWALGNMGWEITPLVTGLGVGGIAVALAAQNFLGDLFASFSILFDKPFVVGDAISVDNLSGTVEYIGLKTTRVRSLSGEQLVFSNADLLKSRIRNFKVMQERRVLFTLGVVYQTPYEKLARIPELLREVVERQPLTRFERAHLTQYGDSALLFEVAYWVTVPSYLVYMDTHHNVNLAILKRFGEEAIEFAYPTRSVRIVHDADSSPLRR
jgi:small-conductance mechanosensitive channel